jgi:hypothetical protein
LRIAETVGLDVDDIRLSARKGSLRVRGKGARCANYPVHPQLACDEDAYRILIAPGQMVSGVEDQALRGAGKSRSWQRRRTGCIAQNMSLPQPPRMVFAQLGRHVVALNDPFCARDSSFRHGRRDCCLHTRISRD